MLRLELGRVANDPYVWNFLEPHVGSPLDAVGRGIRAEEAIHNFLSAQSGSIVSSLHLNFGPTWAVRESPYSAAFADHEEKNQRTAKCGQL